MFRPRSPWIRFNPSDLDSVIYYNIRVCLIITLTTMRTCKNVTLYKIIRGTLTYIRIVLRVYTCSSIAKYNCRCCNARYNVIS